ncbi:Chromatin structure remodeling complex protein sfh1 [Mortierella sp. 14UC]|nr:Chromatin structure remodeling complex protein sfh1 [Mortierella sp. 14UC]
MHKSIKDPCILMAERRLEPDREEYALGSSLNKGITIDIMEYVLGDITVLEADNWVENTIVARIYKTFSHPDINDVIALGTSFDDAYENFRLWADLNSTDAEGRKREARIMKNHCARIDIELIYPRISNGLTRLAVKTLKGGDIRIRTEGKSVIFNNLQLETAVGDIFFEAGSVRNSAKLKTGKGKIQGTIRALQQVEATTTLGDIALVVDPSPGEIGSSAEKLNVTLNSAKSSIDFGLSPAGPGTSSRRTGGSDRGSPAPSTYSTRPSRHQTQAPPPIAPQTAYPPQQQQQQTVFRPYQPPVQPHHPQQQHQRQQPHPIYPNGGAAPGGHHSQHHPYPPPQQPHHAGSHNNRGMPAPAVAGVMGTYSTYASRIREANSALVLPPALGRRAKRAVVSMAESDEDDWDFEDNARGTPTSRAQRQQQAQLEKERLEKEKKAWTRRARKTRHHIHSQKDLDAVADQDAILVPIRLDIDTDDYRLRDTFTWNVNEQLMTPESFAEILCDDLDLSSAKFVPEIAQSIRNQIAEFEPVAEVQVPNEGSRVVVQLDLHVGGINLRDRFEWDVGSDLTPEEFSRQLAADLGIGGEFVTMIAHEIHEQLYRFKQDRLLDRGFEPEPLYSGFRHLEEAESWAPALETLTAEEYERVLEDRERSVRRNRRATSSYVKRRGGPLTYSPASTAPGIGIGSGYISKIANKRGRNASSATFRHPANMAVLDMAAFENWQCQHCGLGAHSTVMLRAGPAGEKSLCNTCGLSWAVHGNVLPADRLDLFRISSSSSSDDVQIVAVEGEGSVKDEREVVVGTPSSAVGGGSSSSVGTPALVSEVGA